MQRAYEHIKAQEQKLESQLSHISEEVKGIGSAQALPLHCLLCSHWQRLGNGDAPQYVTSSRSKMLASSRKLKSWVLAPEAQLKLHGVRLRTVKACIAGPRAAVEAPQAGLTGKNPLHNRRVMMRVCTVQRRRERRRRASGRHSRSTRSWRASARRCATRPRRLTQPSRCAVLGALGRPRPHSTQGTLPVSGAEPQVSISATPLEQGVVLAISTAQVLRT